DPRAVSRRETAQEPLRRLDRLPEPPGPQVRAVNRCSLREAQTTAAFTQWIGGSALSTHSNESPPSRPRQSWPVVVPNQPDGRRPSSRSSASRSTVNQASFFGKPLLSLCHFSPAFSVRHTAGRAPGQVRVAGSSGTTYAVSGS